MHFTLQQLGLVDAPAEQEFDNLTRLGSELLGVPVAHVSIADYDQARIFYKSQCGHPEELVAARELPMEQTYCQHVTLMRAPIVIPDARVHPLLVGTPALVEGSPLAYLGIPVEAPGGNIIGGLCVMQPNPRQWNDADIAKAKRLAACVSDLIRLKTAQLSSERLRREQRDFTYAISHDLQSPTNTLKMILGELAIEADVLNEDARMFIAKGLETVQRMGTQMEDVLAYSRTVDVETRVEPVDLRALVEGILADLTAQIRAVSAIVDCGNLPVVHGDAMQLRILFQNLIGNALKFCHEERQHTVWIRYRRAANGHRIEIEDNGIGIRPEDQKKVFNLFNRLNLREKYAGTGIGLSLCQRVAENHHAAIAIHSDGYSGTEFSIEFPERAA